VASYRRPKGTVVRPIPDWNLSAMANCVIIGPELTPGFHELAINNNATDGSVLIVWDVTLNTGVVHPGDGSVMTAGFQLYPYIYGGTLNPPAQLDPRVGVGFGGSYFNSDVTQIPAGYKFGPVFWGPVTWSWPHDWPFCLVPPNWTLSASIDLENGALDLDACSFTFEVARYP
jgi:hypothetical protein